MDENKHSWVDGVWKKGLDFGAEGLPTGSKISELRVRDFRTGRSGISEQNSVESGSRFSELGKLEFGVGFEKRG